ncbi:hypothetical protein A2U01_0102369, partial [Trifolium medium]|nr:hypothetical protein [Trifolium medium]
TGLPPSEPPPYTTNPANHRSVEHHQTTAIAAANCTIAVAETSIFHRNLRPVLSLSLSR